MIIIATSPMRINAAYSLSPRRTTKISTIIIAMSPIRIDAAYPIPTNQVTMSTIHMMIIAMSHMKTYKV